MRILLSVNFKPIWIRKLHNEKFVNEGWIDSLIIQLSKNNNVELALCYPQYESFETNYYECEGVTIYGYHSEIKKQFKYQENIRVVVGNILKEFKPDVVHIMGTEFPHSLAVFDACSDYGITEKTVVSVQGLISKLGECYLDGIPSIYTWGLSIQEVFYRFSLRSEKRNFLNRGNFEKVLLSKTEHVIGRTEWDYISVKELNPDIKYYKNEENLRESFYCDEKWSFDACEKHSVFLCQGTYPIKGLHYAIQGIGILKEKYPDVKLYIGGKKVIHDIGWKRNSYSKYLHSLIQKYKLYDNIIFCGVLDSDAMKQRYLKSNVCICSSILENSSNSLAEAMLLGVPVVASNVGGTPSMIKEGEGLLYAVNDIKMMAQQIDRIFRDEDLANSLSEKAKEHGLVRQDKDKNINELVDIYRNIVGGIDS